MTTALAEFVYRLPGRVSSSRPGAHRSNSRGSGLNFVSHARLLDQPDPRRLDLRASISSIQRDWLVRINQQRAAITVSAIVDVSATMHFGPVHSKLSVVADFLEALGYSASRLGDAVGLQCFDQIQRDDLSMPPRFGRGIGQTMADIIRGCDNGNSGRADINALSHCIQSVAGTSALVFIVSDFHWPLDAMEQLLDPLDGSLIVPLVVWDQAEAAPPQQQRLVSFHQTGARNTAAKATRPLWLQPSIRQQWIENVARRQQEINDVFASRDVRPVMITNGFEAEDLSRYFMETRV